jgi:hypothetical protein
MEADEVGLDLDQMERAQQVQSKGWEKQQRKPSASRERGKMTAGKKRGRGQWEAAREWTVRTQRGEDGEEEARAEAARSGQSGKQLGGQSGSSEGDRKKRVENES